MSGTGLKPLSDEELLQREAWRAEWHRNNEQRRQRDEQQRLEHHAAQAEAARRKQAIAAQDAREKAQHELRERRAREVREREIAGLHLQAARHESFRRDVITAARNTVIQQKRQAMVAHYENVFNGLDRALNPPPVPEPPEPQTIYVEENRGPQKLDYPELRRWFER
jgi:hypothetical protein